MDDLEELRKSGITATKVLKEIKERTPFEPVLPYGLDLSLADLGRLTLDQMPQYINDNSFIEECHNALKNLDKITAKLFCEWMDRGDYYAIGYDDIDNPNAVVINPNKWNYLTIDFKRGSCSFENIHYFGLRFLSEELILSLPQELQGLFEPKANTAKAESQLTQIEKPPGQQKPVNQSTTNISAETKNDKKPFIESVLPRTTKEEKEAKEAEMKQYVINVVAPYLRDNFSSNKLTDIGKHFKARYDESSPLEKRFHEICTHKNGNDWIGVVKGWLADADNCFIIGSAGHKASF